jgi:hypothetical protein
MSLVPASNTAKAKMDEMWGEPCSTYEHGCAACHAYRIFNGTGEVPTVDEVSNAMAYDKAQRTIVICALLMLSLVPLTALYVYGYPLLVKIAPWLY